MNTTQAERLGRAIVALRPRQMGALPLLYPILEALRVRQTVNELVSTEADIDLGRVVLLLTLNRLLAPQPLYQVQDWLAETVLPEVLGIAPQQAYDNRLGRALDRLYPPPGRVMGQAGRSAVQVYDLDLNVLHWDITSISDLTAEQLPGRQRPPVTSKRHPGKQHIAPGTSGQSRGLAPDESPFPQIEPGLPEHPERGRLPPRPGWPLPGWQAEDVGHYLRPNRAGRRSSDHLQGAKPDSQALSQLDQPPDLEGDPLHHTARHLIFRVSQGQAQPGTSRPQSLDSRIRAA
jgi:hypothetical protein